VRSFTRPIRHALVRLFQPLAIPIRSGPLRGRRWSVVSGSRFLLGTYEPPQARALGELVEDGDVVCDVGAHMGYFAAIASLQTGPTGRVHAFEPRPLNSDLLRRHVRINALDNVDTMQAAVGQATGQARFESRTGTGTGHLSDDGDLVVRVVALDDLRDAGHLPRLDVLRIDAEGAEAAVLSGASRVIGRCQPRILLATHGKEARDACVRILDSWGYRHHPVPGLDNETELVALRA
jgi:FkbM family methyltransferase